jgi:hypothetical protein
MKMTFEESKSKPGERISDDNDLVTIAKLEAIQSRCSLVIKHIKAKHEHQTQEELKSLKTALIDLNRLTYKDDYASHIRLATAFTKSAMFSSARVNSGPKANEFDVEGMFDYNILAKRLVW